MKKFLLALFLSVLCCLCAVFFAACGDNRDAQIVAVYDLYAQSVTESGETPLSYDEWIKSIKGADGKNGIDGKNGVSILKVEKTSTDGLIDTYTITYSDGNTTVFTVINGAKGDKGSDGKSAYEIWKDNGHTGTEDDFLNWLKGEDENPQGLDFYPMDDGTYSVAVGNAKELSNIVIPATYNGKAVTKITKNGFSDIENLASVTIPDSVTSIGEGAFSNCPIESATIPALASEYINNRNLKTVEITSGDSIGHRAFFGCTSLTSITVCNSVTGIGDYAFAGCSSLKSVTIGNGITRIGIEAFNYCISLTSVNIPDSVTSIEHNAFGSCYKLVEIINKSSLDIIQGGYDYGCIGQYAMIIHDGESKIVDRDGYLFIKGDDNKNYLVGYNGSDTELSLPTNYKKNYTINCYAFFGCESITKVIIPENVTDIGEMAFSNCTSLTRITIPDSVISIGNYTFDHCTSLTNVTIPGSVLSIGYGPFSNCWSLTSVTVCEGVTSIAGGAFFNCRSLTGVTIPDSVTSIGERAFSQCTSLTGITIPDSVTSIGGYAFFGCNSLTSAEFKETNGWTVTRKGFWDDEPDETITISSSDLSNTSTAADYLKNTYSNCTWQRG